MTVEVLIAGAGPTGLTAAIELARRGVPVRVVDRADRFSAGSRGDGLQARTQEVFEDLGVLDEIQASGMATPLMRMYAVDGSVTWEGRMAEPEQPRPDVPYPNGWFVPQWRTEEILRERLAALGVQVELRTELVSLMQDETGVTARLLRDGFEETVRVSYLVGADGGRSVVRKSLGIAFEGETNEEIRMQLADVRVDGLDHELGHAWMLGDSGSFFAFTPLATGPDEFVIATQASDVDEADLSLEYLQRTLEKASGRTDIRLRDLSWITVWRLNVRMAEQFAVGRVFLAGDAAHVHPPTGGQGLNTGIQDAYNLGWKLASVLAGAPAELLETYQAERLPVAANVLRVSTKILKKHLDGDDDALERGEETRQLDLSYGTSPLAVDDRDEPVGLAAGDRAPDAPCVDADGRPVRLFELFAGPHWTLLRFGSTAPGGVGVESYEIGSAILDVNGHAAAAYGVAVGTSVLVRPDGYVGLITSSAATLDGYLGRVLPVTRPKLSYPGRTVSA